MTERLRDVEQRIGTVRQLSTVITAMRGIAASRVREANEQRDGILAYAGTVSEAIGEALALALPATGQRGASAGPIAGELVIAVAAEQGFAGAFSERVLARLEEILPPRGRDGLKVLLVGDRALMVAAQRGLEPDWALPMAVHAGQVAALAERVSDRLYSLVAAGQVAHVRLLHAGPDRREEKGLLERRLLPFDYGRFPKATGARSPLTHLPADILLSRLAEEYVFAEICEALTLSLAAENEARIAAMTEARGNVGGMLDRLSAQRRHLRQEQITEEIVELSATPR